MEPLAPSLMLAFINLPFNDLPIWMLVVVLVVGFAGLTFGGDWLTSGAATISINLKINPVVVGLTVVSIATSMPELVTSLLAVEESPGLALGNILGSNIANIGLILGITALIWPLTIQLRLIRREAPILLGVTILFTLFAADGFQRWEGIVLLGLTIAYLCWVICGVRQESGREATEFADGAPEASERSSLWAALLVLVGAALLALGADTLVGSSVEIARRLGVSDTLVGLTIVATGTSLPELAAAVAAARAGHGDLCAGNIVGSNLFNLLLIGGCVSTVGPFPVDPAMLRIEFPAVLALTALLLWFFKTSQIVSRREGVVLLLLYAAALSLSALSQTGRLFP